jgi:hypothetical protein
LEVTVKIGHFTQREYAASASMSDIEI